MKSFVCSLCHNGILGGCLYLDSQSLTYKTNKLTVDKKYRNLVLLLQEIKEISWKWMIFPFATVNIYAKKEHFEEIYIEGLQIFADIITLQPLQLIPNAELPTKWNKTETFITPAQNL